MKRDGWGRRWFVSVVVCVSLSVLSSDEHTSSHTAVLSVSPIVTVYLSHMIVT